MRKTYMMLLALVLTMMGASDVMAQKIYQAKLDKSMFKAWDGFGAVVNEVTPESYTGKNDATVDFACETNFFKELGGGSVVYGNTNVYYKWYANLTGTTKMIFKGTDGVQLRVLFNRPEPDGDDPNGGTTVEKNVTIANGTATLDVSDMEFVHLNCIKTGWGSPRGTVFSVVLVGTVEPVVGIKSLINNGDAEGDDLASFPVSYDGPNNGDSAPDSPEIVSGEGVDGSKCFKVTSFDAPTETWHTQFYIKADEVMAKGKKWKLKMFVKADEPAVIQTSAQAQPRQWRGGFIDAFEVGTEWKEITRSGEITQGDDIQSFAFDLSTGAKKEDGYELATGPNTFYFDNIEFGYDLGGESPVENFKAFFEYDCVRIDMTDFTNIKDLVKAAPGGQFLLFPNGAFQIKEDGDDVKIFSAEARPDGQIYLFLMDNLDEDSEVEVIFNNPADANCHLKFVGGEFDGQDVPDFIGVIASYLEGAANGKSSSNLAVPTVVACDPEIGSFNLPKDTKIFKVTFDNPVKVADLVAKLGSEELTKSPAEGSAKEITLTRTGSNELNGSYNLTLTNIKPVQSIAGTEPGSASIKFSFGPVVTDGDAQIEVVMTDKFDEGSDNMIPAGWKVVVGSTIRLSDGETDLEGNYTTEGGIGYSGNGARLFKGFGEGGDFTSALYFRTDYTEYGSIDGYNIPLEAGKAYKIHFNAAKWKDGGMLMKLVLLNPAGEEVVTKSVEPTPNVNGQKPVVSESAAVDFEYVPEESGDYVMRFYACNAQGETVTSGMVEMLLGNVSVKYYPDVLGLEEVQNLTAALNAAKATRTSISDERYNGADYDALDALINDVEANMAGYTAPSTYAEKTAALKDAAKALADHQTACDTYDSAIKETVDLVAKFKDTKFAPTEYYQGVVKIAEKYHATTELKITLNEETQENDTTVVYKFDIVKEKDALTTATKEVSDANLLASKWLTEGASGKGWGWITTGYAALHERIRRGVALLESLGVAKDDALIVRANAELGDNDEIADEIVARAQEIILTDLAKGAESKLFEAPFDEELEEYGDTPSYDLSVFFKNPNCYGPANSTEVPGWTSVQGNCFAWSSWDGAQNHSSSTPYPEDCDIHAGWHPNPYAMVEQTVTNLPAGVYVVSVKCNDNGASWDGGTCAFIRTSDCDPIEEGVAVDRDTDFTLYVTASGELTDEDGEGITITDGQLGVGFYYNNESQAFFEEITAVKMVAPADGYDYAAALTSIKNAPATAKVRAIQVYDLNGRRMIRAQKGLQIVKKQMSDGTVRVEKLIVK